MKKLIPFLAVASLLSAPMLALGQESQSDELATVSVDAKGEDVRSVLHSLFGQVKKSYVLDPGVRYVLYLSLKDIEFEEALNVICKNATLTYELQNGIYFVRKAPAPQSKPAPKPEPAPPKGKLPETVLNRTLTTRLEKADIRALFNEIGKSTDVKIEVDASVPAYKLDAFLIKTSLKFALTQICTAAKLEFVFTNNLTILIRKKADENRVALSGS